MTRARSAKASPIAPGSGAEQNEAKENGYPRDGLASLVGGTDKPELDAARALRLRGGELREQRRVAAAVGQHDPSGVVGGAQIADQGGGLGLVPGVEDHVGLLYAISQALAELDLDIYVATVSTEKGAAIDTFYVQDQLGHKVTDDDRLAHIKAKLQSALELLAS